MKDQPWYTYAIAALIVLGLAYMLYFKPKGKEIKSLREDRAQIETEIQNLKRKKTQVDTMQSEIQDMTITLAELESVIPQSEEISEILLQIQRLAMENQVEIKEFSPEKQIEQEFYYEKPIPIQLTGNYVNLTKFFFDLSQFERIFNIGDFSIKAINNQSDQVTLNATMTAKTYIFREEPPLETAVKTKPGPKLKVRR